MTSITSWNRLEPLPTSENLTAGLRAEIADPLWFLGRQYQFGELRGEDAGSPIQVKLTADSARLSRFHPGRPGSDARDRAIDHDDTSLPLEVLVEREPVWSQDRAASLRVEAGLHFLRLLRYHKAANRRARYVAHYALADADFPGDDAATAALRRAAVDRVPDGRRIFDDLLRARGRSATLTSLPDHPDVGADRDKVVAAANDFLQWWDRFVTEAPDEADSWKSERLEHCFAVQADLPGGRVVLRADEYPGGRLDWHHFRAETSTNLGEPRTARPAERIRRTVIPTPVSYAGMPADRLWEIEDETVRFGDLTTGRTDLARLLLGEFALTYGNDWFVVPIDLPVGSVCDVESFTVVDTFGVESKVGPATDRSGRPWEMFAVAAPGAPRRVQNLLFLPPVLFSTEESDPFEETAFFRDEMANVVWGVERRVPNAAGGSIDRYEEMQRQLGAGERQQVPTDVGDAELIYRLQSFVPDHWYPFVPINSPAVRLERRPVVRIEADGSTRVVEPKGEVLNAAEPLRIEEEEVPRSGVVIIRRWQSTRWMDGRTVVWSGRRKRSGKGEGSSGLRYDSAHKAIG